MAYVGVGSSSINDGWSSTVFGPMRKRTGWMGWNIDADHAPGAVASAAPSSSAVTVVPATTSSGDQVAAAVPAAAVAKAPMSTGKKVGIAAAIGAALYFLK